MSELILAPIHPFHEDLLAIPPDIFPHEFMDMLECAAVAQYRQICEPSVCCGSICQRPENPCIVDIDYCVGGDGRYELVPEMTAYSLDTTDGINGTWHILQALDTDPLHSGSDFVIHGEQELRFVADMCDHVSSFFSEPKLCFRITIREWVDQDSVFGGFDDVMNPVEPPIDIEPIDPYVAPVGGCRQKYYGPRLPRA